MIQRAPKTVYVNPQQLQRQREHRDEARKSVVANPDPAHALARAWRTDKFDVSLTVSPIRDKQGRVIGASKILRDISTRKRLEKALLQKRDK